MPLTFNLRHLEKKDLQLQGEWPAEDLDVEGVDELVRMNEPVRYDITIERLKQSVLVRGRLRFVLNCHCARCLQPFRRAVEIRDWTCTLLLEGEERVAVENDCVDLTPYLREDILLAFPQHPLCKTECSGLPFASQNHPKASEFKASGAVPSAWDELNKLKL
ncbi:MAG: DUF177 domain-containing protein [Verrucomicrobia bacterium]|nr:DUF177 domain-containing protein [Verrucomicrobiota bacterium]